MAPEVDAALLEMFAAEVEVHMAALNDGLLALEQNPRESVRFEALMRAAHSIKGAARLVGLQAAVDVAHVIEDCFVAAREGRLAMTSGLVDVLLAGVDLLGRVAQFEEAAGGRSSTEEVASTVERILQASHGNSANQALAATEDLTAAAPIRSLRLPGDLDDSWVHGMHQEISRLLCGPGEIEFELSDARQISPLGLALLAATVAEASAGKVRFVQVPHRFVGLFSAVGLNDSVHPATQKV